VARFARKCAVAFEGTGLPNEVVTGAPLREAVLRAERSAEGRRAAREAIGVPAGRFLLAVAGGSLGARRLNEAALRLANTWAARGDVAIYHVAGARNLAATETRATALGLHRSDPDWSGLDYRLVGYEQKMPALLAACDLAICRAGASTVAELAAIGTPSILVPLPGAPHDHQTRNAEALTKVGAAQMVRDDGCTAEWLSEIVQSLIAEPGRLAQMAVAAAATGHRDAAQKVAELVESVSKGAA
jgi:UDP-N-acetylglucosamine--N-acetylmuramyl-(pentapeptide) pyrophosphoryl-undecaprenol N-acetylglucosamine transferase